MPTPPPFSDPLLTALRTALPVEWQSLELERLKDKGLAHDHVRLVSTGLLARLPKQSQLQLNAADNLAYQAACFERGIAGGQVPRLQAVLPPSAALPRGALLVEEITGRPAHLPQDLTAITLALAALHALPLPAPLDRAPIWNAADPLRALLDEVTIQASVGMTTALPAETLAALNGGLKGLSALCASTGRPTRHLIAFDGHPGNFVVRPDGSAVLVDLEKCRYSYPSLDLAHATLYTSTTWDVESCAVLTLDDLVHTYRTWAARMPAEVAQCAQRWHVPLRRAMWLWSITWCAKWQALSGAAARTGGDGEDWSAQRSDSALVAHVRERVAHYLSPAVVAQILQEFTALEKALARA